MVSAKLVHRIEDHWEAVSLRFIRLLRTSHGLPHVITVPESEITDMCRRLLHNLGHWLASNSEEEMALYYEKVGRERHREGIPFSEALRTLQLLKDSTLSYIRDSISVETSVDLYAEEELENQLGRFFDLLCYHMARGYEQVDHTAHHA